jgi:hypothetical protein
VAAKPVEKSAVVKKEIGKVSAVRAASDIPKGGGLSAGNAMPMAATASQRLKDMVRATNAPAAAPKPAATTERSPVMQRAIDKATRPKATFTDNAGMPEMSLEQARNDDTRRAGIAPLEAPVPKATPVAKTPVEAMRDKVRSNVDKIMTQRKASDAATGLDRAPNFEDEVARRLQKRTVMPKRAA